MMENRYCMNCMRPMGPGEEVCPACGHRRGDDASPAFALPAGAQLHAGKYLVGRVLGQGGFGITYVGLDQSLGMKVAIKEYFPSSMASRSAASAQLQWHGTAASHEAGRESFVKEARKMAKIHRIPNVVEVRDVFYENDTAYIVMDFIEGRTLRDQLAQTGPMGAKDCIRLLQPIMTAIDKAHQRGLIHRDVSPDNIMLDTEGTLWLLDLGAAKEIDPASAAAPQSSQLVVKHGFSPPEQCASAGKIGPWTDVYAMCATIYYCVTGQVLPDAMDRMLGAPVTMPPSVPQDVAEALELGLALRPEDRIQSMRALMAALNGVEVIVEPPPPEFRTKPKWVKPALIAAACAAVIFGVLLTQRDRSAKAPQESAQSAQEQSYEEPSADAEEAARVPTIKDGVLMVCVDPGFADGYLNYGDGTNAHVS